MEESRKGEGEGGVDVRAAQRRALTIEVHVPGVVAVLVLPDGLADGTDQRDGQEAPEQHQDLEVGDALHVGQL